MKKDINFFTAYYTDEKQKKSLSNGTAISILVSSFIVIMMISIAGVLTLEMNKDRQKIKGIQAFLTRSDIESQLKELELKQKQVGALTQYNEALLVAGNQIQDIPVIDQSLFSSIAKVMPQSLSITQISYNQGKMTLKCKTTEQKDISNFVHSLRTVKQVHEVVYKGYQTNDNTTYECVLDLVLKAGGGMSENNQ